MDMKKIGNKIITGVAATAFYATSLLAPTQAISHPMQGPDGNYKPHYHESRPTGKMNERINKKTKKKYQVVDKRTHIVNLEGRIHCLDYKVPKGDNFNKISKIFGYDDSKVLQDFNLEIGTVGVRADPKDLDKGATLRTCYFTDHKGEKHSGDLPASELAKIHQGWYQASPDLTVRDKVKIKNCYLPESTAIQTPSNSDKAISDAAEAKKIAEKALKAAKLAGQKPAGPTINIYEQPKTPAPKAAEVPAAEKQLRYNIAIEALVFPKSQELKLSKIYNVTGGFSINPYVGAFNKLETVEHNTLHSDNTRLLPNNRIYEQIIDNIDTTITNLGKYAVGLDLEQKIGGSDFSLTATGGILFGEETKLVKETKTINEIENGNLIGTGSISNQKTYKTKTTGAIYGVGLKYDVSKNFALTGGVVKSDKMNKGYFGMKFKF